MQMNKSATFVKLCDVMFSWEINFNPEQMQVIVCDGCCFALYMYVSFILCPPIVCWRTWSEWMWFPAAQLAIVLELELN